MSSRLDFGERVVELIRGLGRILDLRSTSCIGTGVLCWLALVEFDVDIRRLYHQFVVVGLPLCRCVVETVNCGRNKV